MRVLVVSQEFPPMRGGIGTHCYQMAYHWSAPCDVTVIAPRDRESPRAGRPWGGTRR